MADSLDYIDWLRGKDCVVDPKHGPGEVSHLRHGATKKKPDERHYTALPMCASCHREFHQGLRGKGPVKDLQGTWQEFEKKHNINLWYFSAKYLRMWLWEKI